MRRRYVFGADEDMPRFFNQIFNFTTTMNNDSNNNEIARTATGKFGPLPPKHWSSDFFNGIFGSGAATTEKPTVKKPSEAITFAEIQAAADALGIRRRGTKRIGKPVAKE